MIDENFVVNSVATFLAARGFDIEQRRTTTQTGVDLRAKHPSSGELWLVEAKGQTSAAIGSRRHGKPFNSSQIRVHVAMALYAAAALRQLHPDRTAVHVAIALPDCSAHRKRVVAISQILDLAGIEVLWVSATRQVTLSGRSAGCPTKS